MSASMSIPPEPDALTPLPRRMLNRRSRARASRAAEAVCPEARAARTATSTVAAIIVVE